MGDRKTLLLTNLLVPWYKSKPSVILQAGSSMTLAVFTIPPLIPLTSLFNCIKAGQAFQSFPVYFSPICITHVQRKPHCSKHIINIVPGHISKSLQGPSHLRAERTMCSESGTFVTWSLGLGEILSFAF